MQQGSDLLIKAGKPLTSRLLLFGEIRSKMNTTWQPEKEMLLVEDS